jgi:murein DD-endopeptidase MepM/ murein hydrolase activator NlpD
VSIGKTGCAALLLALIATPPARAEAVAARLLAPVSPACVSSPFGPRILPGKPKAGTYHYGIDLPAVAGAPVRAAFAGTVAAIHKRGPGGLEIVVQHTGFQTLYAHLGSVAPALAEGKRSVAAGDRLGVVGRTGVSYGTHVYFEVIVNGQRIDPAPLLGVVRCGAPAP